MIVKELLCRTINVLKRKGKRVLALNAIEPSPMGIPSGVATNIFCYNALNSQWVIADSDILR